MTDQSSSWPVNPSLKTGVRGVTLLFLFFLVSVTPVPGQKNSTPKKLPSAEKIVDNYLKAIGGKKNVAAIKDATYEWVVQLESRSVGTAIAKRKPPASERWETSSEKGVIVSASSSTSAWELGLDNQLHTRTGIEGATAKLHSLLDASHLVDIKKLNVLARVVSLGDLGSEPAYIVEFSTKGGAKLQYYFSLKTGLITRVTDDTRKTTTCQKIMKYQYSAFSRSPSCTASNLDAMYATCCVKNWFTLSQSAPSVCESRWWIM